jgi:hypothetical protein
MPNRRKLKHSSLFHPKEIEFKWKLPVDEKKMMVSRENIFIFPLRNATDYFRLKTLRPAQYAIKIGLYNSLLRSIN